MFLNCDVKKVTYAAHDEDQHETEEELYPEPLQLGDVGPEAGDP